jgi:hypothetical protein
VRPATPAQVNAIYGLAKRRKLNLADLLRSRFTVRRPEDLSLPAASALIDELKKEKDDAPSIDPPKSAEN